CGRITRFDRHLGLTEYFAGVQFLGDDMDRAPADKVSGLDRSRMRVEPSVFREQRRVDVDDPPLPFADEPGGKNAHEPRERDGADAILVEGRTQPSVEFFLVDAFAVLSPGRESTIASPLEARRIDFV